jgi:hypothetical protein
MRMLRQGCRKNGSLGKGLLTMGSNPVTDCFLYIVFNNDLVFVFICLPEKYKGKLIYRNCLCNY